MAFEEKEYISTETNNDHRRDVEWLKQAQQVVLKHIDISDFRVKDLASSLSITSRELNKKFRKLLKMTGNSFIRNVRIERSKTLLNEGHKNITEIAFEVGFTELAYFSRVFKAATGSSPKNWQKVKNITEL